MYDDDYEEILDELIFNEKIIEQIENGEIIILDEEELL